MSMFTGSYSSSSNEESTDNLFNPFLAGALFAAVGVAPRYGLRGFQALHAYMAGPRIRKFYHGGFKDPMTRREAALILGVGKNAEITKIKEAHRRVMIANHPDAGGSHYLASKINEAKDMMLGKIRDHGCPF